MKTDTCQHPNVEHTIWYMLDDDMIPGTARRDNHADAIALVEKWIEAPPASLLWVKVFRSDNESYTCWRWRR